MINTLQQITHYGTFQSATQTDGLLFFTAKVNPHPSNDRFAMMVITRFVCVAMDATIIIILQSGHLFLGGLTCSH